MIAGLTKKTISATIPTDPSSATEFSHWLSKMSSGFLGSQVPGPWPNQGASFQTRCANG